MPPELLLSGRYLSPPIASCFDKQLAANKLTTSANGKACHLSTPSTNYIKIIGIYKPLVLRKPKFIPTATKFDGYDRNVDPLFVKNK